MLHVRKTNIKTTINQTGFQKIRAPKELFDLLTEFWNNNRGNESIEWKSINSYHNMWDSPPYFVSLEDPQFGGGDDMQRKVWRLARPVLEEWTGQKLSPVYEKAKKNDNWLAPTVFSYERRSREDWASDRSAAA